MRQMRCWRCQKELPMLDAAEWAQLDPVLRGFTSSIRRHREYHSSSMDEARAEANMDPALELYFKLTGYRETNIDALWHKGNSVDTHTMSHDVQPDSHRKGGSSPSRPPRRFQQPQKQG